ncbi:hypothetical protein N7476_009075 [Penicillium atrosanguineum]|uniref:Uncharacterized protein n=1 Tax=Penicillium atrosanguineum TaxID=1132637 RepID=A0A9W9U2P5_9EURO|nr:hypothetical protein N7526_002175 [Penicillium atrosanguineum]KAJ5308419.1 hypothetical protein N7476_009075 [Penicillium atrosanguineum]
MKMYNFIWALLALYTTLVQANVEKTIFIAPTAATVPSGEPDLDDLGLERLSPENPIVRTRINASFPSENAPEGIESWFFLENLNPHQRYEVRVCWLATQPTTFTLTTHEVGTLIEDASLVSSLSIFSTARLASPVAWMQNPIPRANKKGTQDPAPTMDSVLFLRVRAAADYFSPDEALMRDVPPVAVDLILDPFLWNVFPRSLVPTAGWIGVVAVVAIVVARWVAKELGRVVNDAKAERALQEAKKGK